MLIQTKVRYLDNEPIENTFVYDSGKIFDKIKVILAMSGFVFEMRDDSTAIHCVCGTVPSSTVIKMIRDKINTSLLVFDNYIGILDKGKKVILYKR